MNSILLVSVLTLSLLLGLLAWLSYKKAKGSQIPTAVLVLLLVFASLNGAISYFIYPKADANAYKELVWQPLVPEKIEGILAEGKTVFVDVSADWCNICKANKDRVLHQAVVVERLKDKDMVLMRGDLTHSDAMIEAYLAKYQAYGVPFNIVYSQAHPNGLVLPRVLSIDDLLSALPLRG
ncbi:thioredoxin family protein [Shewanella marisflavi]|uniref:thioredoxin family protein n=1 Tax=Shewanella marisflavi TaxID=260364 RepID=UPI003AAF0589